MHAPLCVCAPSCLCTCASICTLFLMFPCTLAPMTHQLSKGCVIARSAHTPCAPCTLVPLTHQLFKGDVVGGPTPAASPRPALPAAIVLQHTGKHAIIPVLCTSRYSQRCAQVRHRCKFTAALCGKRAGHARARPAHAAMPLRCAGQGHARALHTRVLLRLMQLCRCAG